MTDTTLGALALWRPRPGRPPIQLALTGATLAVWLIALTSTWTAVASIAADIADKRCDGPIGKLAVKLKQDQYFSGCRCMKHALDFSDPCNSMYIYLM